MRLIRRVICFLFNFFRLVGIRVDFLLRFRWQIPILILKFLRQFKLLLVSLLRRVHLARAFALGVRLLVLLIFQQFLAQLIDLLVLRISLGLLVINVHYSLGRCRRAEHALVSWCWRLQKYLAVIIIFLC